MFNGIEGIPGSGKSYEAVAFHILPALKSGRKVITNLPLQLGQIAEINPDYLQLLELRRMPKRIRGTWDADAASRGELAFRPFPDGTSLPPPDVPVFGHVWDFYDDWRGEGGIGPLYVVDECHNAWPRELPVSQELKEVTQWAKLSRHFGADVTGITQSWRDVHQPIAGLLATLVKLRKADILGKNGYIRKVHGGYRGACISQQNRDYDPQIFRYYKSHTQGQSVEERGLSDVSPFIKRFRYATFAVLAVGVALTFWSFGRGGGLMGGLRKRDQKKQDAVIATAIQRPGEPVKQLPPASVVASSVPSDPVDVPAEIEPPEPWEPLKDHGVHLVGMLRMAGRELAVFAVSTQERIVFELTSDEIQRIGYRWESLADCVGVLEYPGAKKRSITCDPPISNSGQRDRPVVMDSSTGEYSDGRNRVYRSSPSVPAASDDQILIIEHEPPELKERYSITG